MRVKNLVGKNIRQARKEKRVTQAALAAKLQLLGIMIDRTAIAKLESGRRPVTDIEIAAISKVLEVDILLMFEGTDGILGNLNQDK